MGGRVGLGYFTFRDIAVNAQSGGWSVLKLYGYTMESFVLCFRFLHTDWT